MKRSLILAAFLLGCTYLPAQQIEFDVLTVGELQNADNGAAAFSDIDNDGDPDLLLTGSNPIAATLYKNDGSGNFSPVEGTPFEGLLGGAIRFADVDGDNDEDVLVIGYSRSPLPKAQLYLNDGTGNFTLVTGTPFEPSNGGDARFADLDNDNDPDLVITGYDADANAYSKLYRNNGKGVFTEVSPSPFAALKNSSVVCFDSDNDKDLDILFTGEDDSRKPHTYLYTNQGSLSFVQTSTSNFDDCKSGDVAAGDSDGDGDMDVLITGRNQDNKVVSQLYLNDGSGVFSLAKLDLPGTHLGGAAFADFDNDGDQDIFLLGSGPTGLMNNDIIANIYENKGSNNFQKADSLIGAYLSSMAIADIDGDKDLDMVIVGTSVGNPARASRLYRNAGTGTVGFTATTGNASLALYPNPSQGTIHLRGDFAGSQQLKIYSSTGQLVYQRAVNAPSSTHHIDAPAGLYSVVIELEDRLLRRRLVLK